MDELMKALECCVESRCGECPYQKYSDTHYTLRCSYKLIADLAASDLKPERHGRWETDFDYDWDGNKQYFHYHKDCDFSYINYLEKGYSYCPNCGAKMVLE